MFKMRFLLLLACLGLLSGCAAPGAAKPATPTPLFACDTPGSVSSLSLDQTTRGYSYHYAVYLPPCYDAAPERSYPVLYLVPGRISGPMAWFAAGADRVANEMILKGEIPPFIIVGTESINADMYADAILADLAPYIASHYRVSPERRHHAVAGGSLGGIAAYRIAFRFPDQFAGAGMFGSGAIHGEEEQIRAWLAAATGENRPRVFLNSGSNDPLMLEQAEVMVSILDEFKLSHTEIFDDSAHDYSYWIRNFPAYYRWLAEDW